jgi:hypothetical protein
MAERGERIERDGWRFCFPLGGGHFPAGLRDELVERALAAVDGRGATPVRRSRHAATYCMCVGGPGDSGRDVFLMLFDASRGFEMLKRMVRGTRSSHVVRVTAALNAAGFCAPPIILLGEEGTDGRAMVVTERIAEERLPKLLRERGVDALLRKRAVLRALGGEIARLHGAGFVHGDLTPYNLFVARGEPPRFIFIDHERTRRGFPVGRWRRRLRNLVQLGRFELPGLTHADRMRVFRAYAEALKVRDRGALLRRAVHMLSARIARDREAMNAAGRPGAGLE